MKRTLLAMSVPMQTAARNGVILREHNDGTSPGQVLNEAEILYRIHIRQRKEIVRRYCQRNMLCSSAAGHILSVQGNDSNGQWFYPAEHYVHLVSLVPQYAANLRKDLLSQQNTYMYGSLLSVPFPELQLLPDGKILFQMKNSNAVSNIGL